MRPSFQNDSCQNVREIDFSHDFFEVLPRRVVPRSSPRTIRSAPRRWLPTWTSINGENISPPVLKDILDLLGGLGERRALLKKPRHDPFDQRDLGVFESLKPPAVELKAQRLLVCPDSGFDHFQDARFTGTPVAASVPGTESSHKFTLFTPRRAPGAETCINRAATVKFT